MFFLTTSMPTPRPDTSVTTSAVEKPGSKIRFQTSASVIESGAAMPRSRALASSLARFRPLPSSRTSMTIEPPWCEAERLIVPCSGLPLARRSSGDSMPWSQLLRTRCVSGSVIFLDQALVELGRFTLRHELDLLAELGGRGRAASAGSG
jgi:hypothetical protein